jgi:hypothetical protein
LSCQQASRRLGDLWMQLRPAPSQKTAPWCASMCVQRSPPGAGPRDGMKERGHSRREEGGGSSNKYHCDGCVLQMEMEGVW